jgi:SAM-dependent methyltransferase
MQCRLCGAGLEHVFVDLGSSPAANSFLTREQLEQPEVWYPLKVMVCDKCWLVQMDEYKPATEIFNEDYPYYSSHSPNNVSRAKEYVEMMMKRFNPQSVLEIGSNDGYLLQWFKARGCDVLGFDPAEGAAKIAEGKGIPTFTTFFSADGLTRPYLQYIGQFDLICGSNVLAHNPNLNDFVEGLRISLKPDGVITMEFPHLLNLLNGTCQFDTIYHEHYSYLSFMTVCEMFKRHKLAVFDVIKTPEQGGSLLVFFQHELKSQPFSDRITELLREEWDMEMNRINLYQDFQGIVEQVKFDFLEFLVDTKTSGRSVAAYGASCKCNTLFNFTGVRPDLIPFVVDRSPLKQGKYLPGSHVPIVDEEHLKREKPDFVIITAWNLKDEIMEQLDYIREWGGKFVLTVPGLQIF